MKMLLTLAIALSLSQAFAATVMTGTAPGATGASSTTSGVISTDANLNQRGTGTVRTNNNSINNTNTTTDTIGTTQSSTTTKVMPNVPGSITPADSNATSVNCVDSSGRNYGNGETGYTACVNSMRTR